MQLIKKYITLLLPLTILFVSCDDWFDLQPQNSLTQDEYWQTKEEVKSLLMSSYQTLSLFTDELFQWGEVRGDMLSVTNNSQNWQIEIAAGLVKTDQIIWKWNQLYSAIGQTNYVLKFAPDVLSRDNTFTQRQLDAYLAEAHFLRALSYFYLVRVYGDVPIVLDPAENDEQDFAVSKSDEEEVISQIISDLKYADKHIYTTYGDQFNNKGRGTRAAVHSLFADVYLWNEQYDSCVYYTDKVLADERLGLVSGYLMFDIFYPGYSFESIFELYFNYGDGQNNQMVNLLAGRNDNGSYRWQPSQVTLNRLNNVNEVVRGVCSYNDNSDEVRIWKHIGRSAVSFNEAENLVRSKQSDGNFVIYRLADIMLKKAEALTEMGQLEDALLILNEIRFRARVKEYLSIESKEIMRERILEERAIELAFEGKRWFDLLRYGKRNNYEKKEEFINIVTGSLPLIDRIVVQNRLKNTFSWYAPIHIDEIGVNKNLEQNPYYVSEIE
ncbi:MAG: RagB/SusD family nutrient uptake outer membrane protein [Bacteroidales bacterium]|nr:RagB/SusD family nutrient uptake outer membrane protein [Bacteroidales bacterium]